MSEKDLEQFNADVQENEAATAAPVDNASPEAIGEAIKEINGEADASAAPEKADDELQVLSSLSQQESPNQREL